MRKTVTDDGIEAVSTGGDDLLHLDRWQIPNTNELSSYLSGMSTLCSMKRLAFRESIEQSGTSADSQFASSSSSSSSSSPASSYVITLPRALVLMRSMSDNTTHRQGHSPAC
jgi:hypothetical protein